jgi:hypothetical protein
MPASSWFLELAQPLGQQGLRHARHAAPDVVEAAAAAQELANHQRRPQFSEHFGAARHRAELAIVGHRGHSAFWT